MSTPTATTYTKTYELAEFPDTSKPLAHVTLKNGDHELADIPLWLIVHLCDELRSEIERYKAEHKPDTRHTTPRTATAIGWWSGMGVANRAKFLPRTNKAQMRAQPKKTMEHCKHCEYPIRNAVCACGFTSPVKGQTEARRSETACSPAADRDYVTDVCITLRCELEKMKHERDDAAKLVRRLLRSHGEKSSRRSVAARADAGLWLARYDSENNETGKLHQPKELDSPNAEAIHE